ncbi:hypothetical protein OS187_11330 [Xanthomonadaceae bacterium JHOS43]|nr:hypothetical protein [Xanthomonadaceae bacterium JHOS43]
MRWLWFAGSLVCFVVLFKTTSIGLALLCLIGALIFMIVGTLAVAAQRIESSRSDVGKLFGPEEIRQMREAEARRKAAQEAASTDAGIVGVATASALIAAESAGRDDAPPASPTPGDTPDANP